MHHVVLFQTGIKGEIDRQANVHMGCNTSEKKTHHDDGSSPPGIEGKIYVQTDI